MLKNQVDINDLIGKTYKEKGRGPDSYDCYGLCMEVSRRIGVELPKLRDLLEHEFKLIEKPETGAIVLIEAANTRHVGIMLDNKILLQVRNNRAGVHKISIKHPQIKDRIIGFYKYVG